MKKIYVNTFDGSTSMSKRKKIIKEYVNSERGILCSARVLNEGVNIPIIDSVCFLDDRKSTIDIVQCIGRSLRLSDKKKMAYVFLPTFIENIDDEFDKKQYGNIVGIIKALKSTDRGIAEYFVLDDKGSNKIN